MSRNEILRAALALGRAGGTRNVTMRSIALATGTSATAVYRHFSSKEELLDELAHRGGPALERHLTEALTHGEPRENLLEMCRAYVGFALADPWLYRLVFEELRPEIAASVTRRVAAAFARQISQIEGVDAGRAAMMLVSMTHGIATFAAKFTARAEDPEISSVVDHQVIDEALRTTLRALCGHAPCLVSGQGSVEHAAGRWRAN